MCIRDRATLVRRFDVEPNIRRADVVFAALAGEHRDVLYDSVRQPMWRGDAQKI